MKKVLYYAIRVKRLYPCVVAVTSVKKGRYGVNRWYGRDCRYVESTNGTTDQLRGSFDTQAEAEAMLSKVQAIEEAFEACRHKLDAISAELWSQQKAATNTLFTSGEVPAGYPGVVTIDNMMLSNISKALKQLDPAYGGVIFAKPDPSLEKHT